ncbi:MAG: cysteine peptidase family C39 domain-containing protein [Nanoarchaeota archaeon]|nr:C39 family peptidase [Nanoarchaeota archaeon]MBU4300710.1 C39 family peptidase [Nanoarchaeota archaeon]MBU4451777.1 C39 family peptidase [Nanoarchaeota archaeon]MCG2723494.1 cysteine peptidase family C39 domain-containing protein [archaeon]
MPVKVPYHHQKNCYFCGPTCLKMVLETLGIKKTEDEIARIANTSEKCGTHHQGMIDACKKIGFSCFVHENANMATVKAFLKAHLPVIIDWTDNISEIGHYSVMIKVTAKNVFFCDPWYGPRHEVNKKVFEEFWNDRLTRGNRWIMAVLPRDVKIAQEISLKVNDANVLVKSGRVYQTHASKPYSKDKI